jgi:hypothetical protein
MKNNYSQFYPLSQEQLEHLWSECFFVFDTNVLFNLYRYSKDTSKQFLDELSKLKSRLWLPYQVGYEFHRNRRDVISDEISIYKDFLHKFSSLCSEVENKNRNPFLLAASSKTLTDLKVQITEELHTKISEYEEQYEKDKVLDTLIDIFQSNVGNEYTPEQLSTIYKAGESRYKDDIPPGFQDKKKPHPERFGDLLIWSEMKQKSLELKKPLIFVTDDGKEDWWFIHNGKTISPRPELIKEFQADTNQLCHFYKPFQFLKYSNEYLGTVVKNEVIDEVKEMGIKSNLFTNIWVNIKIKSVGSNHGITDFVASLERDGYKTSIEQEPTPSVNVFTLSVVLPNIPDLERRFNNKYLSTLSLYGIELLSYSSVPL